MGVVSSARYERVVCVVLLSISTLVLPSSSLTWRRIYSDVYSLPACSQGVRRATHLIGGAVRGASVVEGAGVVEGRLPALRLRGGSNAERDEDDDAPPRPPVDEYPPPSEGGDPRPEYGRGGRRDDKDLEEAHRTDYGDSWRNRNEDDEGERADYRRGGRARGYRGYAERRDRGYGEDLQDDRYDDAGAPPPPPPPHDERFVEARFADPREPRERGVRESTLQREYDKGLQDDQDRRGSLRPQYDDVDDGRRLEEVTGNRPYDDGREPDRASRSAPYMPRYYDYEERRRPGRYEGRGPPPAYSQRSRYDRSFSPPRFSRERGRDPRDRDSYRSGHGRGRGSSYPPYDNDSYWPRDRTPSIPKDRRYPDPRSGETVSLLIRNLSRSTTSETLRKIFSRFGRILDVYIPRSYYKGIPRGFAFVEFENYQDCKAALRSYDGTRLDGRIINICFAQMNRKTSGEMRRRQYSHRSDGYKRPRLYPGDEGSARDNHEDFPPPPPRPASTEPFSRSMERRPQDGEDAYPGPHAPERDGSEGRRAGWTEQDEPEDRAWRDVEGPGDREYGEEQEYHDREREPPAEGGGRSYSKGQAEEEAVQHDENGPANQPEE